MKAHDEARRLVVEASRLGGSGTTWFVVAPRIRLADLVDAVGRGPAAAGAVVLSELSPPDVSGLLRIHGIGPEVIPAGWSPVGWAVRGELDAVRAFVVALDAAGLLVLHVEEG